MENRMSEHKDRLEAVKSRVEEMGVFFEKRDMSPITARVFAYLLVAEPPYQDFYQIQSFLSASKSSISNALKYLMDKGSVEYVTFSGDRRRYFKVNIDGWMNQIKDAGQWLQDLNQAVRSALNARTDTRYREFNNKMAEVIELQEYLAQGVAKLVAEWEARKKQS